MEISPVSNINFYKNYITDVFLADVILNGINNEKCNFLNTETKVATCNYEQTGCLIQKHSDNKQMEPTFSSSFSSPLLKISPPLTTTAVTTASVDSDDVAISDPIFKSQLSNETNMSINQDFDYFFNKLTDSNFADENLSDFIDDFDVVPEDFEPTVGDLNVLKLDETLTGVPSRSSALSSTCSQKESRRKQKFDFSMDHISDEKVIKGVSEDTSTHPSSKNSAKRKLIPGTFEFRDAVRKGETNVQSTGLGETRDRITLRKNAIPLTYEEVADSPIEKFRDFMRHFELTGEQKKLCQNIRRRSVNRKASLRLRQSKLNKSVHEEQMFLQLVSQLNTLKLDYRRRLNEFAEQKDRLHANKKKFLSILIDERGQTLSSDELVHWEYCYDAKTGKEFILRKIESDEHLSGTVTAEAVDDEMVDKAAGCDERMNGL